MKRIWYCVIICLIIIAICTFQNVSINHSLNNIKSSIEEICTLYDNKDIDNSIHESEQMLDKWEEDSKTIKCFVAHEDIDNITEKLRTIESIIKGDDKLGLEVTKQKILFYIEELKESQQLLGENIL